jgi:uncharacterized SAM-binding protein YcdF (DUF218 family)
MRFKVPEYDKVNQIWQSAMRNKCLILKNFQLPYKNTKIFKMSINIINKFRLPKYIIITLLLLFLLWLLWFGTRAGTRLVIADEIESADLIMVLMGPIPDRALQAADLYHHGVSSKIVFCNDYQPGARQLLEYQIKLDNIADIAKSTLVKLGVHAEHIHILDHFTSSTQDEAIRLRDYLLQNPAIESVVLVTSSYHSRRTYTIFSKVFRRAGLDIDLYISENPYTEFLFSGLVFSQNTHLFVKQGVMIFFFEKWVSRGIFRACLFAKRKTKAGA